MRVNIPVRSRGWGFRGRRISHAAHPPPTNTNFPIGKKSYYCCNLRIKVLYIIFLLSLLTFSLKLFPFQLKAKKQKLRQEVEVFQVDNY